MLRFETPAPIFEAMPIIAYGTRMGRFMRRVVLMQLFNSETVLFRTSDGEALAVLGFYPLPDEGSREVAEVWFACRPDLAEHMIAFIRAARLTCARMAEHGNVVLRAFVREGHAPGARIATLARFERVGFRDGWELWEWSEADGKGNPACIYAAEECATGNNQGGDAQPIERAPAGCGTDATGAIRTASH